MARLRSFPGIAAAMLLAFGAAAQSARYRDPGFTPDRDPYLQGDHELLTGLGFHKPPFSLDEHHGTLDVDRDRGMGPLRWLETTHFKIGSSLSFRLLPVRNEKRREFYAECRLLAKSCSKMPREPKEVDEWLQLHLLAFRLEAVYADLQRRLGVDAAWFARQAANRGGAERGNGPHLGCRGKFVVLAFDQEAQLARYLRQFHETRTDGPTRRYLAGSDALMFATSAESWRGMLQDPVLMHAHVVHEVVQNLVEAFVGNGNSVPLWFGCGLGHWYARDFSQHVAAAQPPVLAAPWQPENWPQKVGGRVRHEVVPELATILHWSSIAGRAEPDHAVIWSLADYVMAQGDPAFRRWMLFMREHPLRDRRMPEKLVLAWHDKALRGGFGYTQEEFAEKWRRHVRKRYR